ncbi:hypothetical protein HY212_05065 [Candidatus Pacearchaeota archaeon]|nr:hypothetical protein [Candidatus Pacearchaeota archaeon]
MAEGILVYSLDKLPPCVIRVADDSNYGRILRVLSSDRKFHYIWDKQGIPGEEAGGIVRRIFNIINGRAGDDKSVSLHEELDAAFN